MDEGFDRTQGPEAPWFVHGSRYYDWGAFDSDLGAEAQPNWGSETGLAVCSNTQVKKVLIGHRGTRRNIGLVGNLRPEQLLV